MSDYVLTRELSATDPNHEKVPTVIASKRFFTGSVWTDTIDKTLDVATGHFTYSTVQANP